MENKQTWKVGDMAISLITRIGTSKVGLVKGKSYQVKEINYCKGCGKPRLGVMIDGDIQFWHIHNFEERKPSLQEQLDQVVECEDYRLAAKLHKQIKEMT